PPPRTGAAPPAAGAVLCAGGAALWLASARRATDPVLPPRLLRDRAVGIPAAIAFLIGAALFGSIAYMPAYLQIALGASALEAGLLVTALMGGVLVSTVVSGRLVTRTGRYRGYPIAGTAVAAAALVLLSQLGSQPDPLHVTAVLALLGLGIGLVMQIMVLAAQNAAGPADTGQATAAVTFLRQIGASAGVAAFGALLTVRFGALLPDALAQRVGGARLGAEVLDGLAPGERAAVAEAFGSALPPLLGMAAPLMGAAFVLALLLPSRPLRDTPHADPAGQPPQRRGRRSAHQREELR
ncbi:MFS transporter, partial [Nocardiopsis coralliicola]